MANIIDRLASRFTNAFKQGGHAETPDALTRDIGGHFRNNQPYISGYFQVMFGLPSMLFSEDEEVSSKWLHSTCESFTPHTQNLTKVDIMGQGQIGSSFVANVMTTREVTCAFREYQHMPIMNIIRRWNSIFDPFTGTSPLAGKQFIPTNYKGWLAVMQTKPVRADASDSLYEVNDVEECYIYQGVFPTTLPVDTASAEDITANDTVQLSDLLTSAEEGVTEKVISLFNSLNHSTKSTYDKYMAMSNISTWAAGAGNTTGDSPSGIKE